MAKSEYDKIYENVRPRIHDLILEGKLDWVNQRSGVWVSDGTHIDREYCEKAADFLNGVVRLCPVGLDRLVPDKGYPTVDAAVNGIIASHRENALNVRTDRLRMMNNRRCEEVRNYGLDVSEIPDPDADGPDLDPSEVRRICAEHVVAVTSAVGALASASADRELSPYAAGRRQDTGKNIGRAIIHLDRLAESLGLNLAECLRLAFNTEAILNDSDLRL